MTRYYLDPTKYEEVWPRLKLYLPPEEPGTAYLGGSRWFNETYGTVVIPQDVYNRLPPPLRLYFSTNPPVTPTPIGGTQPSPNQPTTPGTPTHPSNPTPPGTPTPPSTYQGYVPDVDYLRTMPWNIPQAYQTYADIATRLAGHMLLPQYNVLGPYQYATQLLTQQQREIRESPTLRDIGQQYRRHIEYLQAEPGQGEYDRAYLTTAFENIDRVYDAAKQRMLLEYARRGIEPSSGIVQSELRKIEEARAADKAKAERDLAMWKVSEQRSRLAEARGIAGLLAQLESAMRGEERGLATQVAALAQTAEDWATGRALRALPVLYQIPQIAQALDVYERARRAEARGIETMLDEIERQRMMDMLAILGGTQPPAGGIAAVSPYAANITELAAMLGQQAGQAWGSLGQIIGSLIANWPGRQVPTVPTAQIWSTPVTYPYGATYGFFMP